VDNASSNGGRRKVKRRRRRKRRILGACKSWVIFLDKTTNEHVLFINGVYDGEAKKFIQYKLL